MKKSLAILMIVISFAGCKDKTEKTKPQISDITESVYASGIIKSKDQYQAFATVNGIIETIFVNEGDTVNIGTPILSISNRTQKLASENALLNEQFASLEANQGKLADARQFKDVAKSKMLNDSLLYYRQKTLWQQQIGTKVELEQRELAFQNSKAAYFSAAVKFEDLKRQLNLSSEQAKNNYLISSQQANDFTLKSEIKGTVYNILKSKGEIVGLQTPLAVIGNSKAFILEMQVDEYDIFKVKQGQEVLITMDSYKNNVFNARVTKIYPLMNERSKTFLVEAEFTNAPANLYPNITFEANIVIRKKDKALIIPRSYLISDSLVVKEKGDTVTVKTGLKDYQKVEILSGLSETDVIIKAKK